MKAKINFGEGGIQGFLVRHVEKFVLGVAALMVAYILYGGATLEKFDEAKNPQDLQRLAQSARSHITSTTWDQMKEGEGRDIADIEQRLKTREGALPSVSDAPYRTEMAWLPPTFPLRTKRSDPEIFPPVKVEAVGQYGAIAMNRQEGDKDDPIIDDADALKKEEEKKAPKKPRPSASAGSSSAMMMPEGMSSMPYGSGGSSGGSSGGTRKPSKEQLEAIPGYQVGGAAGMMMESSSSGSSSPMMSSGGGAGAESAPSASGPVAKGFYFVAIKALFPIKKQWEEYERCFADTGNYEPGRDSPKLVYFKVERAEVAGPNDEPQKWEPLNTGQGYYNFMDMWAGVPDEIASPDYIDPVITLPAPPLMNRPLDSLMLHTDVPRRPIKDPVAEALAKKPKPGEAKLEGDDDNLLDVKKRQQQRPMGRSNSSGYGMGSMSSEAMMSNSPYGSEGMNYGYGSESTMDSSGGYGGQSAAATAPNVDYKLIRFYDFRAEPGKHYRYRVQVWLEDPNHPAEAAMSPRFANLDDPVVLRLREIEKKEAEKEKTLVDAGKTAMEAKMAARLYWRETKWSEPSNVAEIPQQYDVLAGTVEAEKHVENKEAEASFPRQGSEPLAKVMTLVWDPRYAVDVPGEADAYRGSVMNLKKHMEVLHPIFLVLKTLDYDAKTNNVVLDIRGGESMPVHPESKDAEPLSAPGEVLLVDHLGRLQITREAEDMDMFQRYDWPEEKVEKKAPAADAMNPEGMMNPDMGYPGMGGGRQRRGRAAMSGGT